MGYLIDYERLRAINKLSVWVTVNNITLTYSHITYDTNEIVGLLQEIERRSSYNYYVRNWLNALRQKYINSKINNL